MPNGEVEEPARSARLEPRVHTVFRYPRRYYRLSRSPPTIVRSRAGVRSRDVIPTRLAGLWDPKMESAGKRSIARWTSDLAQREAPRHKKPRDSKHNEQSSICGPNPYQNGKQPRKHPAKHEHRKSDCEQCR